MGQRPHRARVGSYCQKARNDRGYWERLDEFLTERGARLSHGICDACFQTRFPDLWAKTHAAAKLQ